MSVWMGVECVYVCRGNTHIALWLHTCVSCDIAHGCVHLSYIHACMHMYASVHAYIHTYNVIRECHVGSHSQDSYRHGHGTKKYMSAYKWLRTRRGTVGGAVVGMSLRVRVRVRVPVLGRRVVVGWRRAVPGRQVLVVGRRHVDGCWWSDAWLVGMHYMYSVFAYRVARGDEYTCRVYEGAHVCAPKRRA